MALVCAQTQVRLVRGDFILNVVCATQQVSGGQARPVPLGLVLEVRGGEHCPLKCLEAENSQTRPVPLGLVLEVRLDEHCPFCQGRVASAAVHVWYKI